MGFSLDLPNEEATKQELVQETAVKPEVMEQIDANVKNNADAIFAVNLDNFKDKKEITNVIENRDAFTHAEQEEVLARLARIEAKLGGS